MYKKTDSASSTFQPQQTPLRINFSGTHILTDKSFIIEGHKFIIKERKKTAFDKPSQFICTITPFNYISSLYVQDDNSIVMEYQKQYFKVIIGSGYIEFLRK